MAVKLKTRAAQGLPRDSMPSIVNAGSAKLANIKFQRWLDKNELRLYADVVPVLMTGAQAAYDQSPFKAESYLKQTLGPIFLAAYRRIYYEAYQMVDLSTQPALKEAAAGKISDFLQSQIDVLTLKSIKLAGDVSDTLVEGVRNKLIEGVRLGWSNDKIATELRKAFPSMSKAQAATIARTEVHTSAIAASSMALAFKKIKVKTKTWWSSRDNRVRETHALLHGQTVPADEPFVSASGAKLRYPGDSSLGADGSETINCRCAVLWNTEFASTPTPVGAEAGAQPTPAAVGVPESTAQFEDPHRLDVLTALRAGQKPSKNTNDMELRKSHKALPGFIEEWKDPSLNEGQQEAVNRYIGSGYRGMNNILRKTDEELRAIYGDDLEDLLHYRTLVDDLDSVFKPTQMPLTTYRGTNLTKRMGNPLQPGDVFSESGFISSSRSAEQAIDFAKKAADFTPKREDGWADLLQIEMPSGTKAIITNDSEWEVILKHGQEFRVLERELVTEELLKQDPGLTGIKYIYKIELIEDEKKPFELIPEL